MKNEDNITYQYLLQSFWHTPIRSEAWSPQIKSALPLFTCCWSAARISSRRRFRRACLASDSSWTWSNCWCTWSKSRKGHSLAGIAVRYLPEEYELPPNKKYLFSAIFVSTKELRLDQSLLDFFQGSIIFSHQCICGALNQPGHREKLGPIVWRSGFIKGYSSK